MPWGVPEDIIDQAARDLGLTAVTDAILRPDGELRLLSGGKVYTIPAPASGRCDTLPRGSSPPAFAAGDPPNLAGRTPTEGPVPPLGPGPSPDILAATAHQAGGPAVIPSAVEGSRLDDLTAIDGVGPVTAATLHKAGFNTYSDLDKVDDQLQEWVPAHVATKIRAWLHARKET